MSLPSGANVVRLCYLSGLGDEGEITAACFAPHIGTDERPADRYLSVHWLEYLQRGAAVECLASLRAFLLSSTIPGERRPTSKGLLAVLDCDRVIHQAQTSLEVAIDFSHQPRIPNAATGVEVTEDGTVVRWGIASEQVTRGGGLLDPHCGLFTLPEEAAHELAVQQMLVAQVHHVEPGKLR